MNTRIHRHSIRKGITEFCIFLAPFYRICELFGVGIEVNFVKGNVEMVNYSLQLYKLVEKSLIVLLHDTFLATDNDFNGRLRTSMELSETKKKYCFGAISESCPTKIHIFGTLRIGRDTCWIPDFVIVEREIKWSQVRKRATEPTGNNPIGHRYILWQTLLSKHGQM